MSETLFSQRGKSPKNFSFVPNPVLNYGGSDRNRGLALKLACSNFDVVGEGAGSNYAQIVSTNPYFCTTGAPLLASFSIPAPKEISYGVNVGFKEESHLGQSWSNWWTGWTIGEPDSTSGRRELDAKESMFGGVEKRRMTFIVTMVAVNEEESQKIATIANALNGYSLPYYSDAGEWSLAFGQQTRGWSPPLWRVGIGPENSNDMTIYPEWTGQTVLSVLSSVSINTTAAGFPYSIESNKGKAISNPLFTSISMTFTDYEAVYRSENGYNIVMRSGAIEGQGYGA